MPVGRRLGACSLALHLLLISAAAHAQVPPPQPPQPAWAPADGTDVVYLKDGQQLRGTLIELRVGESAKVRLAGGQEAIVRWEGIARMERNGQPLPMDPRAWTPQTAVPPPPPPVRPDTLPYDSDEPIPAGYHVESKPRLGLIISGSILSAIGLFGIVGIEAAGDHVSRNDKTAFDVVWGLLFLGPGLPLLLVGLSSPKKTLRKDASDALWTSPSLDKQPFYVGFGPTRNGGGLLTIGRAF